MKFKDNWLKALEVKTCQNWKTGKAIRPLFADPVAYTLINYIIS